MGADLQSEHERYLVEKHFKCPVIFLIIQQISKHFTCV
jgi:aspartyl/asparaginyl-tRNA synthetase